MAASGGVWKNGTFHNPDSPNVMDFDTYASMRGLGGPYYDPALARMPGASEGQKQRILKTARVKAAQKGAQRETARQEYDRLVESGRIRPPTRTEKLIRAARGHSDNPQVQAARRVLERDGIEWRR